MKSLITILRLLKRHKLKFLFGHPKTIYFNILYFGLKQGLKLPVVLSNKVKLIKCKGKLTINSPLRTGMILWGYTAVNISPRNESSLWNVEGEVVFDEGAEFGVGTRIIVGKNALLKLGSNFRITSNSTIPCYKNILLGYRCLLS